MPHRGPLGVVLALRTDDVVDLLLHQLGQHAEPDADAQREQSLLRCPDQLPQRFLHALWEHGLMHWSPQRPVRCYSRRFLLRSLRDHRARSHRSGRGRGTAVTSKFYEPRDNLPAHGSSPTASTPNRSTSSCGHG